MQRRLGWAGALAASLCLAAPALASAATIQVDRTDDVSGTEVQCTPQPSDCSIRQATDVAVDGDTIDIPAGHYVLNPELHSFQVSEDVTIRGAGARSTVIDGDGHTLVWAFLSPGTITMSGVTVTGGSGNQGGGIQATGSTVVLSKVAVSGNQAANGGGISLPATESPPATISLVDSTVSGNTAESSGGGIDQANGTLFASNSTITGNTVNRGEDGRLGGGIYTGRFADETTLANVTVAGNSAVGAKGEGGNIYRDEEFSQVARPVIAAGFIGPTFRLRNSIIAAGVAATHPNCGGPRETSSDGHNVISNDECGLDTSADDVSADPKLRTLANNGGETDTLGLTDGSPAIGAGDPNGCKDFTNTTIALDQRGVARPQGARCDSGAYESAPPRGVTGPASNVTNSSATIEGDAINPDVVGGSAHFQFGTTTDYGQTTGDDSVPAGSTGAAAARMSAFRAKASNAQGHVTVDLTGLQPDTTYHYRIVASNPDAARPGEDRTFTTGASVGPGPNPQPGPGPDAKPHRPNVRASQFSGRCFRSRFVFRGRVHVASATKLRMLRVTLDGRTIHRSKRARFTVKVRAGKLKPGYHVLLVRATDSAGNKTTVRRAFTRCRQRPVPAFTG